MAEMLLSRGNGLGWDAGMAVEVHDDGWPWSVTERGSEGARVVRIPGVAVADLEKYLEARTDPSFRCRRLRLSLSVDQLGQLADTRRSTVERLATLAGAEENVGD
jgi:hypothetical protein